MGQDMYSAGSISTCPDPSHIHTSTSPCPRSFMKGVPSQPLPLPSRAGFLPPRPAPPSGGLAVRRLRRPDPTSVGPRSAMGEGGFAPSPTTSDERLRRPVYRRRWRVAEGSRPRDSRIVLTVVAFDVEVVCRANLSCLATCPHGVPICCHHCVD